MTDREMLELAAKAAGYDVRWHETWQCFVHNEPFNIHTQPTPGGQRVVWVPLDDDGDALRLAVTCALAVIPYPFHSKPKHSVIVKEYRRGSILRAEHEVLIEEVEVYGADAAAATRRAIVRAAAAIGAAAPTTGEQG